MSLADDAIQLLEEIKMQVAELLERKIAAAQISVIGGLSDISERLGTIKAGEFRSGNSEEPGLGFTGVRMGFPAFTYGGVQYHLVGVNNDVLQFGLSATDGTATAGAGTVVLDSNGISLWNGATQIGAWDEDGNFSLGEDLADEAKTAFKVFAKATTYNGESFGAGDMLIGDNSIDKPNLFWDASTPALQFRTGTNVDASQSAESIINKTTTIETAVTYTASGNERVLAVNDSTEINIKLPSDAVAGDIIEVFGGGDYDWNLFSNENVASQTVWQGIFESKTSDNNSVELSSSLTPKTGGKYVCAIDGANQIWVEVWGTVNIATLNYFGDGSDGNFSTSGNVNLASIEDGDMIVKNYDDLTVNTGDTLTVTDRCKGLMVYVGGDLVINGTLSMTGRGANANPTVDGVGANGLRLGMLKSGSTDSLVSADFSGFGSAAINASASQVELVSNGKIYQATREGGTGAAAATNGNGITGGTIINGSGGGGSGGANSSTSGAGADSTCFSGGAGGGSSDRKVGATGGTDDGGPGGDSITLGGGQCGGGAGNPGGQPGSGGGEVGDDGTGGILIILVKGNVTIGASGIIEADGSLGGDGEGGGDPANNTAGGSSGGGIVWLLYEGSISDAGTTRANGGASVTTTSGKAGGAGGVGTVISESIG